jgi:hypothetical protein
LQWKAKTCLNVTTDLATYATFDNQAAAPEQPPPEEVLVGPGELVVVVIGPTGKDPERTWVIHALLPSGYCHIMTPAPREEIIIKKTGNEGKSYSILGS